MTEKRSAHPYHMYDAIRAQPDRVARVLESQRELIERAAAAAAAKRRLIFAGIGTSLHAACVGEHFLRYLSGGRAHAQVEQSFELVHYPLALSPDDALIIASHRGWKNFSVEALRRAKAAGALTISITGQNGGPAMRDAADFAIPTCEQEISFAHTKSYTTALAALALLAIGIAEHRGWLPDSAAARAALARIPEWMTAALKLEEKARSAAREIAGRQRLFFIGAGPNWATACEGALKVKETSYSAAEGFETEQFLHGPLAEADSRCAAVVLFAGGSSDARAAEAWAALGELGALRVAISSGDAQPAALQSTPVIPRTEARSRRPGRRRGATRNLSFPSAHLLELPATPEWLSPFVHVIPLQLLSYLLALERPTKPDTGREDQPANARAKKHIQL